MNSIKNICILLLLVIFGERIYAAGGTNTRGIDFRLQFITGSLEFTSISGVKRPFEGIGSELQSSIYIFENEKFKTLFLIASRVMTWTGKNVVEAEYDDLQTFSVAPGVELQYGNLYFQANTQRMNANAYNISATSKGKQFLIEGPCFGFGYNYQFGNLGIGFGVKSININVPGESTGLSSPSPYKETSYSLNFVYYMGVTPSRFFGKLF